MKYYKISLTACYGRVHNSTYLFFGNFIRASGYILGRLGGTVESS